MAEDRIVADPTSEPAVDSGAPEPAAVADARPDATPAATAPPDRPPTLSGRGVRARLARIGTSKQVGQPGARAAVPHRAREPPQGRPGADRPRLRHRREAPPRPDAQERRPLHHPPAGGHHDPGRHRHDRADAGGGPAARHGRGHGVHPRRAAHRLRRGGRRPRGRRDQARQGQVRRLRAGRDDPQDDRRDEQGHPCPGHQARRPAAQHAHPALRQAGDPGAQVPRDARDLRPAGAPPGHEHAQVGARGPRLRDDAPARSTTRSSGWSPSGRPRATSSSPR